MELNLGQQGKKKAEAVHDPEMHMLRGISAAVQKVRISNEHIRGSLRVAHIKEKFKEWSFKWFRHIQKTRNRPYMPY